MKFSAYKDNKKRQLYNKWEIPLVSLRALALETANFRNPYIQKEINKNRIKNRCTRTSRAKGVLSFFKLSRMTFKERASFGHIEGIRRSSW